MSRTYEKIEGEAGYYRDPKTEIIYFIRSIDARLVKFSCRTTILRTAKTFANRELKKRLGKTTAHVTPLLSWWMDKYIEERKNDKDLSASAIRNSVNSIERAKEFWGNCRSEEITKEKFAEFHAWFKDEFEGQQFENMFKYFRNFMNWLADETYKGKRLQFQPPKVKNPEAKSIRKLRKEKKERTFSRDEIKAILAVCPERERLLVLLMYTMAFRIESDALSAKWSQFRFDSKPPVYVFGEFDNKAGLEGKQAIHSEVLKELKSWRKENGHSKFVFPQLKDPSKHIRPQTINWERIKKKSGVEWDWTPHFFRHTCLTVLAEKGFPMHLICKCYRISAQEFMETYAHLTPEGIEMMREAVEI